MITIFIRTLIVYLVLTLSMRILGKRQLGELEVSELITTILISEIASMPISNQDIPLSYAIIPLVIIITFEIVVSFISSKFPSLQKIISSPPSTLIYKGEIIQKELEKNRISPEELLSELRLKNIIDPSQVEYAILEQNGLLSVITKAKFHQPTLEQLNIQELNCGIMHIIISQGIWNEHNLKLLGKSKSYFQEYLNKRNLNESDIFLFTIDDAKNIRITIKENKK